MGGIARRIQIIELLPFHQGAISGGLDSNGGRHIKEKDRIWY